LRLVVVGLINAVGRLLRYNNGKFCETNMHNPFMGFIRTVLCCHFPSCTTFCFTHYKL